jgi:hypothetical protein
MADISTPRPHITVSLHANQDRLKLSGDAAFEFEIIATLHAEKAILMYIADTVLSPVAALLEGGIEYKRHGEATPVGGIVRHVNTGGRSIRTWHAENFTVLEPGVPKAIRIPLGASKSLPRDQFDLRFWMNTMSFKAVETYDALLPETKKITWWRYATAEEIKTGAPAPPSSLSALTSAIKSWWNGTRSNDQGVPILPEKEQLSVIADGNSVSFTTTGTPTYMPPNC